MTIPLNHPEIGKRVWTENGFFDHGALEGPKASVCAKTVGEIIGTERPYLTTDMLLYAVRWESGQITKHYFNQLFCIGSLNSYEKFLSALRRARNARLTKGPRGGFREFTAEMSVDGVSFQLRYGKDLGTQFRQLVEPILVEAGVPITVVTN